MNIFHGSVFWLLLLLQGIGGSAGVGGKAGFGGGASSPPPATVTYSGNGCSSNSGSSSATCTVSGVTSGETIYILVSGYSSSTMTLGLVDSNGSPSAVCSNIAWTGPPATVGLFVVINAASGSHGFTLTATGSSLTDIQAGVLDGASASSPTDSSACNAQGTTGTLLTSGNVTTTAANEFLLGFCYSFNGGSTVTAGTVPQAMTLIAGPTNYIAGEYGAAMTAGTNYATCTQSASGSSWFMNLVAVH